MKRRCVNLLLAVSLVSGAVTAQTSEEIAAAISRLEGERLDARAMEFLIDAGKPVVRPLSEALKGAVEAPENPKYSRVLRVLGAIGGEAADAIPAISDALARGRSSDHEWARKQFFQNAYWTLRALLRCAPQRAPDVRAAFQKSAQKLDRGFARYLGLVESKGRGTADPASLASADFDERALAIETLGPDDCDALPDLLSVLVVDQPTRSRQFGEFRQGTANSMLRLKAAHAIARIAPDRPEAARGLALMVESADDPRDRVKAASALGRHGEATAPDVDALRRATRSQDDRLVAEAVTALGMIGGKSDAVLERLRALASDDRPAIARRAEAALRSLEGREGGK